ncbi:MAG: hypothetical protein AB3N20_02340 [Rhizobiaceae bacterium]
MTKTPTSNREEFAHLLPWYVNGTLDVATTEAIEKALETDVELQRNLQRALEDQAATMEAAQLDTVPQSMNARFDAQLEHVIEADTRRTAETVSQSGILEQLGAWLQETLLAGSRPRLALAAAAAAIVILLQSGAIVSLFVTGSGQDTRFDLASDGDAGTGTDIVFLVQLKPQAVILDLSEFLETNGGKIIDGPLAGGMYKLGFVSSDNVSADLVLAKLKRHDSLFQLVLPADGQK